MPEELRGRSFSSVALGHLGAAAEAEQLLAPLRAVYGLAMDLMGPVQMADLGRVWGPATRDRLAAIKSAVDPRRTLRSDRSVLD